MLTQPAIWGTALRMTMAVIPILRRAIRSKSVIHLIRLYGIRQALVMMAATVIHVTQGATRDDVSTLYFMGSK